MCQRNNCKCKSLGLSCTELCGCVSCSNNVVDDDDDNEYEEVSATDSDSESENESDFFDSEDDDFFLESLIIVFSCC